MPSSKLQMAAAAASSSVSRLILRFQGMALQCGAKLSNKSHSAVVGSVDGIGLSMTECGSELGHLSCLSRLGPLHAQNQAVIAPAIELVNRSLGILSATTRKGCQKLRSALHTPSATEPENDSWQLAGTSCMNCTCMPWTV